MLQKFLQFFFNLLIGELTGCSLELVLQFIQFFVKSLHFILSEFDLLIKNGQVFVCRLRKEVLIDEVNSSFTIVLCREDLLICQFIHDLLALRQLQTSLKIVHDVLNGVRPVLSLHVL
jgi:hypothetical protein